MPTPAPCAVPCALSQAMLPWLGSGKVTTPCACATHSPALNFLRVITPKGRDVCYNVGRVSGRCGARAWNIAGPGRATGCLAHRSTCSPMAPLGSSVLTSPSPVCLQGCALVRAKYAICS